MALPFMIGREHVLEPGITKIPPPTWRPNQKGAADMALTNLNHTEPLSEFEQLAGVSLEGTDPAEIGRMSRRIKDRVEFPDLGSTLHASNDATVERWLAGRDV